MKSQKHISVKVDDKTHRRLKVQAALMGKSLQEIVLEKLEEAAPIPIPTPVEVAAVAEPEPAPYVHEEDGA